MAEPTAAPRDTRFFGHPRGLMTLFFTEMWERFSYYGMRAILMLFMVTSAEAGGLGFSTEQAGPIYAMYTSLVYLATVPGGWLADNFLGQRRSVLYGGAVIMLGHILLAMQGMPLFYSGLGCIVIGTGLLKPNISVIVGQLYSQQDERRDSGFSIFYMGINIGAFTSPLVCGWLAEDPGFRSWLEGMGLDPKHSWHWGFGAAAVGMGLGLAQYLWTGRHLGDAGLRPGRAPTPEAVAASKRTLGIGVGVALAVIAAVVAIAVMTPEKLTKDNINTAYTWVLIAIVIGFFVRLFTAGSWTRSEWARLVLITVLFLAASVFWGVFEQAGSTLTLFAERSTRNEIFSWTFPASWWQSVNAVLIIVLAPFFSWLWVALGRHNPSYAAKFGIGLGFVGLGFLWLVGGANLAADGSRVGVHWLLGVYLLHTIGELCLSPVGLSAMTKLAPTRVVSLMMGVWFLAASVGNFLAGSVAGFYESFETPTLLTAVAAGALIVAAIMFALVAPIRRMIAQSEAEGGASTTKSGH
jgi:POT family proton-dependent oligopeptide transporter